MKEHQIRRYKRLGESMHDAILEDGLAATVVVKPGYQRKFASLTVGYGSIDNSFTPLGETELRRVPEGVAHFLEHKLFEDEAGDVFDQFARYGASANAYTTSTETSYHFTTSTHFEECLELLLTFVTDPYFTEEQIEKERQVIAQEIQMYDDDPGARSQLNLMKALYHHHPVREDTAGTVESIRGIDKALLETCHRAFYQPENMFLCLAGDLDPEQVLAQVSRNITHRRAKRGVQPSAKIVRESVEEPELPCSDSVEVRMAVSRPRILIGYKDSPTAPGMPTLHKTLVTYLAHELLFGRSSEFYERHYASGLIDPTFSHYYSASRGGYAYGLVGGETDSPQQLLSAVEECVASARERGLDLSDFRRIRNKVIGQYLKGFNSVEQMASRETDAHFEGWDLLGYLDLLESTTLDDLQARLVGLLEPQRRAVSLVLPLDKGD